MLHDFVNIARAAEVTAPAWAVILVVALLSLCLLFRLNRLGLIIAYTYTLFLGWGFCQKELMAKDAQMQAFAVAYLVFGGFVLLLTAIHVMFGSSDE